MVDELRQRFSRIDVDALRQFVAEQTHEDLHLDLKTLNEAAFSPEDKATLAKSLSGFANSDGGLLIWGVEARKDEATGIDGARKLTPIANIALAHGRLTRLTGEALVPRHAGVKHRKLEDSDGDGYLVNLVPASESPPHMAKLGQNRT